MGRTDGGTPGGCAWLIWGRTRLPPLPSPTRVYLGNVNETPGWNMLENAKISKVGITDISAMHPQFSIPAGNAKSPG